MKHSNTADCDLNDSFLCVFARVRSNEAVMMTLAGDFMYDYVSFVFFVCIPRNLWTASLFFPCDALLLHVQGAHMNKKVTSKSLPDRQIYFLRFFLPFHCFPRIVSTFSFNFSSLSSIFSLIWFDWFSHLFLVFFVISGVFFKFQRIFSSIEIPLLLSSIKARSPYSVGAISIAFVLQSA